MNKTNEQTQEGTVISLNTAKGYAFAAPEGSTERENNVFLHISYMVNRQDFKNLKIGDSVVYEVIDGPKGKRALNIVVEGN